MAQRIEGTVVAIKDDGSLVSDITADRLADAPKGEQTTIMCGGHETQCLLDADHNEPESTLLAMIGASGHLEITIDGMNLSEMLGLKVGETIVVKW